MKKSLIMCSLLLERNFPQFRTFSTSSNYYKQVPSKSKGQSSHNWLTRQLNDPYVEKARMENYRCRSAFKLLEINERFKLFSPGQCIIDCGAAPGSWTQVVIKHTNSNSAEPSLPVGFVIAADRLPIYQMDGVMLVDNIDFTKPEAQERIKKLLDGREVDGVISDMAPNTTGIKELDHEKIIDLAYTALCFALQISKINAFLLVKIFDGGRSQTLQKDLLKFYDRVKFVKPNASRSESSETFVLARDFKGMKQITT